MPTYVYRRPDGTTFEVFQRITDDALTTDPETGEPVERVIGGGAGLIFKGTGFYETDYVRKSGTPEEKLEKASEATSEKASEPKAEAKAEAPSEAKAKPKPKGGGAKSETSAKKAGD